MISLNELINNLNLRVKGQQNAVNVLSAAFYKYLLKLHSRDFNLIDTSPTTVLLYGPSGSGKTYLVEQISELIDIPMITISGTSISQEGWEGTSFIKLIALAIEEHEKKYKNKLKGAVIYIDEFDKMVSTNYSTTRDVSYFLQASLLKYLEGKGKLPSSSNNLLNCDNSQFNLNNCLFILSGAFVGLELSEKQIGFRKIAFSNYKNLETQKFLKYGLIPELAGRIQTFCLIQQITKEVYYEILESDYFVLKFWKEILLKLGIVFEYNAYILIEDALKSSLGVRSLIQEIEGLVTNCLIENKKEVNIDKFSPLYVHKQSNS